MALNIKNDEVERLVDEVAAGECLSHATARLAAEPLLCAGSDSPATDLALVEL